MFNTDNILNHFYDFAESVFESGFCLDCFVNANSGTCRSIEDVKVNINNDSITEYIEKLTYKLNPDTDTIYTSTFPSVRIGSRSKSDSNDVRSARNRLLALIRNDVIGENFLATMAMVSLGVISEEDAINTFNKIKRALQGFNKQTQIIIENGKNTDSFTDGMKQYVTSYIKTVLNKINPGLKFTNVDFKACNAESQYNSFIIHTKDDQIIKPSWKEQITQNTISFVKNTSLIEIISRLHTVGKSYWSSKTTYKLFPAFKANDRWGDDIEFSFTTPDGFVLRKINDKAPCIKIRIKRNSYEILGISKDAELLPMM